MSKVVLWKSRPTLKSAKEPMEEQSILEVSKLAGLQESIQSMLSYNREGN
jgi:hypothetical protein